MKSEAVTYVKPCFKENIKIRTGALSVRWFNKMTEIRIDKLIRSKRRTIALEIARDASQIVCALFRAPLNFKE
ncbi:MAG: hypothetical protein WA277_12050 [Nitrospirota bacterium]